MTAQAAIAALLLTAIAAAIFAGCGNIAADSPATPGPTAEPPPLPFATPVPAAAAIAQAEATVRASYAKSGTDYCGRLCQPAFWMNAGVADLDAEISKGAAVNATGGVIYKGSPLHYAVGYADIAVIAALLDRGADIEARNGKGLTALHIAAQSINSGAYGHSGVHLHSYQRLDVAALLLERGADANAQDDWGSTPLHQAIDPVAATLLLNHGADVNAADEVGWTPLFNAAANKAADTVALLLEHGADANAVNESGGTPLFAAVSYGSADADVIALLLEHGVDVDAKDNTGRTACQSGSHALEANDAIRELVCP